MSFGSRKTIPFFTVLIVCSLLSYKAYCLEKEPIPVDRNGVRDLPLSEEASDFSVDLATLSTDGFSKPATWGTDITISTGPVYGGISTDYDAGGNIYAARCSTYLDSINAMVIVYKSTDGGTSWSYLCGFFADQGSFKYSRPTVLTGSVGNKLYVFHWRSTQNGDIGMARFTQDGTHEGFYTLKSGLDTLSYFSVCSNMGRGDTIVVVYQRDLPGGIPYIYSTVSTDFGEHWSIPVLMDGYAEHPDIAYGQEGNLYLVYNHTGVNDIAFFRGETSGGWTDFEFLTTDGNSVHEDYPEVAALHTFPADTATVWVVYNYGGSGDKSDGTELRFAYSTNSGVDWTKDQTFGAPPVIRETGSVKLSDFEAQPCDTSLDTLWGGTAATYYWTQPTVDQFINMRFEMPGDHGGRLEEIQIALYQGGSVGTPDPDLYVWSSDGIYPLDSSPPAGARGAFHIDYGTVVWYPSYTVVETWDPGIDFAPGEKFHIGVSHAYDPGDTLALLSDDGSMGTDRSSGWDGATWGTHGPYEFLINAVICPYPPVEPCDTTLDTLWGGTSVYYFWQNPSLYSDMYFNERFDMPGDHGGRLEEIQVCLYQSGTLGTPDPELYVWLSDGVYPLDGNPPDGAISAFQIDYDSIIWFPSYTAVESWYRGIEFDPGQSFHIGVGHAYIDGDTLGVLSDDGSSGSTRSSRWASPGQWGTMLDDWGVGVDFLINAVMCPHPPPIAPCDTTLDTLWGGTSAAYYWRNPSLYGDMYLNERFDLPLNHGGRLEEIQISLFQDGCVGTPDLDLYVWLSDGVYPSDGSPPDGAISSFHVDHDSLIWFPSYTTVETWLSGIEFGPGESFHIGFGDDGADGDTLAGLSDDGSSGSNRSVEWAQPGQWGTMLDDLGLGVDFLINVVICPSAPLDVYDEVAADLSVYRSPACSTVDLCYLSFLTVREPIHDIYHTRAHSSSPGQFHAPHDKISDHLAHWSPDGQEVCQMTFSGDLDPLTGIVYAGYPPLKDGAWNLYFDQVSWTDVGEEGSEEKLPAQFSLSFNYPNPFNPTTKIKYTVGTSQARSAVVSLRIYNILGQLVRTLVDEPKHPGTYEVRWDGRDQNGNEVASGIYFYKLQAGDFSQTKKMVLVK